MAKNRIEISCEEMVKMVTKEFITGSDAAFLKKVGKTAKGGGMLNDFGRVLCNKDKTFGFCVFKPLFFFMNKEVIFTDEVNKLSYIMTPKKDWKKFYQAIKDAIAKENNK